MIKMKTEPKTLPGFMELYPNEQVEFDRIKSIIIDTYKSYGFYPLDTPVIEYSEVLLAKAGGETEKQIYRFNKGDNDLSLRFDLTVPLAKYVARRYNELVFPFKRYQVGKVFRGERPQKGRFREFYQCDIDIIGDEVLSLKYDSEIINVIYDIFKKINIGDFVVRLNNRKILNGFFGRLGISDKASDVLRIIDKMEKISEKEVREELTKIGLSEIQMFEIFNLMNRRLNNPDMTESLDYLKNEYPKTKEENILLNEGIEELEEVLKDLKARGIPRKNYRVDLTIARGLDYYTGTVYETNLVDYPSIGSICSGGRYENLAEYYTDKKLPGVGISIGLTRLFYQLIESGIIKVNDTSSSDIIILPMCDNYEYVYEVNNILKEKYNVNICYLDKGFKQKLNYARKMNNKYAIIIGEDEINKNVVTLKDMSDGSQREIKKEELKDLKI
ncbi:MAG: histidine--tRNA ligase [Bacilli bacterium]|nr:histidine--tRNA ligase [Bacilli bacterium]